MKDDVLKTENGSDTVTISRAEYEKLLARNTELEQKLNWLMEQISLARKKQYGSSSEKTQEGEYEQLSLLFNEAETFVPKAEETTVAEHKRKKRSCKLEETLPENVPVETVEHGIDESERACPECGTVMEQIGKEVRRTLVIIPAQVKIREDVYCSYACPKCRDEGAETPILKTPKLPAVIPGSHASAEAIAHIMTQKFVMASPLYRQEQEWKRAGVQLSRQTMSNWVLTAARDWLTPVYNELHKKLMTHDILHADETTLQVLKEPGKSAQSKSYMWLYRTGIDAKHPIVLYEYKPNRKAENAEKFLEGFSGWLHADGYDGYHKLNEGIRVVGCWAHARRKFVEALNAVPEKERAGSTAAEGVAYCDALFRIEAEIKDLPYKDKAKQRREQAQPVLDAFLVWSETKSAPPKSTLGKALHYLKTQWPYLIRYLEDGRLEISNNIAERSIKPFVIGRKNFLFANTPNGAQSSAVIYSLIETAKENGLDPYKYLTWLLTQAPRLFETDRDWAAKLLPEKYAANN